MEEESVKRGQNGKRLIIIGFVAIAVLFVMYSRYQDPELITPGAFDSIQRIANGFYIIMLSSIGAIAYGIYLFHKY
ncbi:MAG: hypothetical protein COW27_04260, partial [Nitrosopumilales archaeon CG15_BIG_FIL_POST_REV_8_21_14_020_37_12]